MEDVREELRRADREYRLARQRRLDAMRQAVTYGVLHEEIGTILGVTRSAVSQALRTAQRHGGRAPARGKRPG